MEQSVRSAEKEFSRKMVQLNSNFEVRHQVSPIAVFWNTDAHVGSQQAVLWHGKQEKWVGPQNGLVSLPLE